MKKYVSWEQVEEFVAEVIKKYDKLNISGIYALPRGGLVLGVILSHKLNKPLLAAPCRNCIIIDDICDSGESLIHYYKNSSNPKESNIYHIVTMYFKENKLEVEPEFYGYNKGEDWIVFPWEGDE